MQRHDAPPPALDSSLHFRIFFLRFSFVYSSCISFDYFLKTFHIFKCVNKQAKSIGRVSWSVTYSVEDSPWMCLAHRSGCRSHGGCLCSDIHPTGTPCWSRSGRGSPDPAPGSVSASDSPYYQSSRHRRPQSVHRWFVLVCPDPLQWHSIWGGSCRCGCCTCRRCRGWVGTVRWLCSWSHTQLPVGRWSCFDCGPSCCHKRISCG